jgi:hypothetical protein
MNVHKIAGLLALLIAVVGAFVAIPSAGLALLVLGVMVGYGVAGEHHVRIIVSALAATAFSSTLGLVPVVGEYLNAIVGGLATFSAGAALLIIGRNMVARFKP